MSRKHKESSVSLALAILLMGSIWGLAEMSLGGFLHAVHLPQKGAVMGGIAVSIMAVFVSTTGKPLLVPLLGIIAASFKPFSAAVFGMPVFSPFVLNPAIAIVMQALAFSVVMVAFRSATNRHVAARAGAGFLAGFLGYALYAAIASLIGLGIWPTLELGAKLRLVMTNAVPIGIAGSIMLIVGYSLGSLGEPKVSLFKKLHPRLFYSASTALVLLCWTSVIVL